MGADAAFADIISDLNRLRAAPDQRDALAALLAEQSPVYAGRSTGEAERLRGYILASFETTGLPESAMAFVIEELESGLNPYLVAAAAKALRGARDLPGHIVPLLLAAIERIRGADDVVRFDFRGDHGAENVPATALMEMFRTLAWLGPGARRAETPLAEMLEQRPSGFSIAVRTEIGKAMAAISDASRDGPASCCCAPAIPVAPMPPAGTSSAAPDIAATRLQDQDGAMFSFGEFLAGRPSVLTFFYTRCMNPDKCSLTITRLARLQKLIAAAGVHASVNVAALTYDPAFDLPARLRSYGADRGMAFDGRNRLLRTTGTFEPFQRWLDLGVGYGSTTVNQHRLDLLILDRAGQPSARVVRSQWDEAEVLAALQHELAELAPTPR